MTRILCIAAALLLAACSSGLDKKFDGSSAAAFKESLARMQRAAKPDEVKLLDDALRMLAVSDVSIGYEGGILGALEKVAAQSPEQLAEVLLPQVAGKTGREVITTATRRKKEEGAKQLAAVEAERARLLKLGAAREESKAVLELITISEPRFGYAPTPAGKMAMLAFNVTNGTEMRLTQLFLRGSAIDPASSSVLFVDDINYKLPAGLQPGETKEIRLPYSRKDKWNAPELAKRRDIELAVAVVNAETAPGRTLAPNFTHKDAQSLATLEAQKPLLEQMAQGK